jgi:post-segregation antitoxin (ccd killing protein)
MAELEITTRCLRTLFRVAQEQRWLNQNREAIALYNRRVAQCGLLADEAGLLCHADDAIERPT